MAIYLYLYRILYASPVVIQVLHFFYYYFRQRAYGNISVSLKSISSQDSFRWALEHGFLKGSSNGKHFFVIIIFIILSLTTVSLKCFTSRCTYLEMYIRTLRLFYFPMFQGQNLHTTSFHFRVARE